MMGIGINHDGVSGTDGAILSTSILASSSNEIIRIPNVGIVFILSVNIVTYLGLNTVSYVGFNGLLPNLMAYFKDNLSLRL